MDDPIGAYALGAGKARRRWLHGLVTASALACAGLLAGCSHEPPEQKLRDTIAGMQAAAEARDADELFAPIAEDFGGPGGMDRESFRRFVTLVSLRNEKVGVQLGPMDVKLFGQDRATVRFTAATSGGSGWLPDSAQVYQVETGWRMQDGDWKLISATWDPSL